MTFRKDEGFPDITRRVITGRREERGGEKSDKGENDKARVLRLE